MPGRKHLASAISTFEEIAKDTSELDLDIGRSWYITETCALEHMYWSRRSSITACFFTSLHIFSYSNDFIGICTNISVIRVRLIQLGAKIREAQVEMKYHNAEMIRQPKRLDPEA